MQAVIMAGGKGTRLKDLVAEIPKPMIPIAGEPILSHQIKNLKNSGILEIIIVVGHLGDRIIDYFKDGSNLGVKISYFHEKELLGTGGALYYLKDMLEDEFILLYGDVFLDIDFKRMLRFHGKNNSAITLFAHPNSHPYDSDIVVTIEDRVVSFLHKNTERDKDYNNLINSGIYVMRRDTLGSLDGTAKDFEKDLVLKLIKDGRRVYAYRSTEYAKDMGTFDRLARVEEDFKNMVPQKRNLQNKQKCIFIDRDGTINLEKGHINHPDKVELYEGVPEALSLINNSGFICIMVTNQPVVARGECTFEDLDNIHKRMETLLGLKGSYIDDIFLCPHHPDKGFEGEVVDLKKNCDCRKPGSGMLLQAQEEYNIDFGNSYIVGDTTVDIETGYRLGIHTVLVETGFSGRDNKYNVEPDHTAKDLLDAVKYILNKEKSYGLQK